MLRENPLAVRGRGAFMREVCRLHNLVNARVGKGQFPCTEVEALWGQKDCGCGRPQLEEGA